MADTVIEYDNEYSPHIGKDGLPRGRDRFTATEIAQTLGEWGAASAAIANAAKAKAREAMNDLLPKYGGDIPDLTINSLAGKHSAQFVSKNDWVLAQIDKPTALDRYECAFIEECRSRSF